MPVGSWAYFERHLVPAYPRELVEHQCINWVRAAGEASYRWEFVEKGRDFALNVEGRILTADTDFNILLAMAGIGLTIAFEGSLLPHVEAGRLVPVLEEYCEPFPGFFIYFSRLRHRCGATGGH